MTDPDHTHILQSLAQATDTQRLQAVLRSLRAVDWTQHPETRLQLARLLIRKGLARDGLDMLPGPTQPAQPEVEQLRAYGLANTGAPLTAARHLQQLIDEGYEDSETLGLLGRTEKDLARRAGDRSQARPHWQQALAYYQRAFDLTGDSYPGINAAALSLRLGHTDIAQQLATQVLAVCDQHLAQAGQSDDWTLSTKAEALLILGQTAAAESCYQQAAQRQRGDLSALGSTVRQARELLVDLGLAPERLDAAFGLPTIAIVSGHRIDAQDRPASRFPAALQNSVRSEVDAVLAALNVGIGYGAAANGADLIFMEALLARGGEVHLVLPMEQEVFRTISVNDAADPQWLERFDQVLEQAASVTIVSEHVDLSDASVLDYSNRVTLGLAHLKAYEIGSDVRGIALWDGQPGLPGGTGDCVALWQSLGLPIAQIVPQSVTAQPWQWLTSRVTGPYRQRKRELMGMLFADIVGYSRLSELDIERFYSQVLPQVAALSQQHGQGLEVTQSFGDAFYFVFHSAQQAAEFALRMNQLFREQLSTFSALELRIRMGLHAGPLLHCFDPVRGAMNYTGRHTSRAARVEPVAPENQILTTQQFAALLALEAAGKYDLAYAGEQVLPKGYGTERLFVLSEAPDGAQASAGL